MRLMSSLSCMAVVLLAAGAAAQDVAIGPRVRAADNEARELLAMGEQDSPTLRQLLVELENSDLIVLVSVEPPAPFGQATARNFHGSTRLLAAAAGQRYLAIWLDSRWRPGARQRPRVVSLLAHELQHALEVAQNPDVVDQGGMMTLFGRIGRELCAQQFETDAALAVQSRVFNELSAVVRLREAR